MTLIPNGYPDIPTDDKVRVQALIPAAVQKELFTRLLPVHGACSSLMSVFFRRFHEAMCLEGAKLENGPEANEQIAIRVLAGFQYNPVNPQPTNDNGQA